MKIGTAALRVILGSYGVSAWIGRTTDVDVGTRKSDGLALRDHGESSAFPPLRPLMDLIGLVSRETAAGRLVLFHQRSSVDIRLIAIRDGNSAVAFDCESQLVSTLRLTCHDTEAERIGGMRVAIVICGDLADDLPQSASPLHSALSVQRVNSRQRNAKRGRHRTSRGMGSRGGGRCLVMA